MFFFVEVVAFELYIWNAKLERVFGPVLDQRVFVWMIMFDIKIGEKYDSCVGSQEDEDMPKSVQIWESHACPNFAIEFVIQPTNHGCHPEYDRPPPKGSHSCIVLMF